MQFKFRKDTAVASLLLALVITSCVYIPAKPHGIVPPGFSQGPWKRLEVSGVSEDAEYVFMRPWKPIGHQTIFSTAVPKVTWWGRFKPLTFIGVALNGRTFVVRWYSPDGNFFWEEEFQTLKWDEMAAKASLPIKDSPAEELPGRWFVQIYHRGELIDEKYFILTDESKIQS